MARVTKYVYTNDKTIKKVRVDLDTPWRQTKDGEYYLEDELYDTRKLARIAKAQALVDELTVELAVAQAKLDALLNPEPEPIP